MVALGTWRASASVGAPARRASPREETPFGPPPTFNVPSSSERLRPEHHAAVRPFAGAGRAGHRRVGRPGPRARIRRARLARGMAAESGARLGWRGAGRVPADAGGHRLGVGAPRRAAEWGVLVGGWPVGRPRGRALQELVLAYHLAWGSGWRRRAPTRSTSHHRRSRSTPPSSFAPQWLFCARCPSIAR
jgi:hypothetical protein